MLSKTPSFQSIVNPIKIPQLVPKPFGDIYRIALRVNLPISSLAVLSMYQFMIYEACREW